MKQQISSARSSEKKKKRKKKTLLCFAYINAPSSGQPNGGATRSRRKGLHKCRLSECRVGSPTIPCLRWLSAVRSVIHTLIRPLEFVFFHPSPHALAFASSMVPYCLCRLPVGRLARKALGILRLGCREYAGVSVPSIRMNSFPPPPLALIARRG